jgi:electron transport complex protein RnfG
VNGERAVAQGAWPMFRAMVGIGLLGGLVVVSAFELTAERIERNRAEALARAIFRVLPGAATSRAFRLAGERFEPAGAGAAGERLVYAGYDRGGLFVGVAIEAQGMGYQDTIRVLYGYSPEAGAIVGMEVLESKETPGLGDKIEFDPEFRKNFEKLAVVLDAAGQALAHAIAAVEHGTKSEPWQVDGITGATVSSKAIANLLDASAREWAPEIARRRADFELPPAAGTAPAAAPAGAEER